MSAAPDPVAALAFALGSAGGGSAFFLCPNPPSPNGSELAIAEEADCCATSPALGIGGFASDGGSGASEAAGRGFPSVVIPIRMTCRTGVPFSLDILLRHVRHSLPCSAILRQHRRTDHAAEDSPHLQRKLPVELLNFVITRNLLRQPHIVGNRHPIQSVQSCCRSHP